MHVLITGGTGFIGSRLALRCRELGQQVRVFAQVNNEAERQNKEMVEAAGAEIIVGSLTEPDGLERACRDIDLVVHLAAAQHEANVPDRRFRDVNVTGTETLLDASVRAGVGRFVYGSTIGVYGRPEGVLDESSPTRPVNIYGATKLEAESRVLSFQGKLPVVVVRISETYGPGDRRLLKLFKAIEKGVFFMIGRGDNLHHMIFVGDLIDGLLLAGCSPAAVGEVFILCGPEAPTTKALTEAVAGQLNRKMPRVCVPLWPMMALAVAIEGACKPLGMQPPLHRRRMDFFTKSFSFSGEKSASVLGFTPMTGLRKGIEETARWYKETGNL